jgi:regulator of protease activity HflC (stomatin/prohibitin superfamily)
MKKVIVNTNCCGLVFKNGELEQVLKKGVYWMMPWVNVRFYDMTKEFPVDINIETLLLNQEFKTLIEKVEVSDNELVFMYKDKLIVKVLGAGRYYFWKGPYEYQFKTADISKLEVSAELDKKLITNLASNFIRIYKIETYEKGILFIDGKMEKVIEPGTYMYWKNQIDVNVLKTDMRIINMDILGQEILTKDKAQLRVNFTLQYKVIDITKALIENKEFEKQLYIIMQLAIRTYVGKLTFDELMETKESLSENVLAYVKDKYLDLGVEMITCGLKDIILPGDIREIMNQVLIAEKRAQANIITRREETASTRSLLNTAKLMEDNVMLYKLKEMEYVEKIADKISNITLSGSGQIVDQLKQIFVK